MGYLYLGMAFVVAAVIAFFAPRAGLLLGALLVVAGLLPALYFLAATRIFGIQPGALDGMVLTIAVFYLSAPGAMLAALSLVFGLRE